MHSTQGQRSPASIPLKLATDPAHPATLRGQPAALADATWVAVVRWLALAVFTALFVFASMQPSRAGRVLWTIAIASLPLFFVLAGYHRWRRICPLAFIAQVPTFLGRAGHRRAGDWLRNHGYRLPFFILLVSLWLRLVATNGDGYAIALFLAAISLAALATGLMFTGKTWCNYVCPVSFVEKLYTEPRGLRETPNSQCRKCTACRPTCPDINEENSYWKEILLPDKRDVFFAFPGVVLAFYVYYYVQAGSWEYYFSGRWTNEVGLARTAFLPGSTAATAGVFFWPAVPRAVAAAATLLIGAASSLAVFSFAERPVAGFATLREAGSDAATVRHLMFSLAAFSAFVLFYSFAGAPTLRLIPGLPHLFQLVVMTTGTLFLVRRLSRRQRDFSEETLARRIVARWPWADTPPPRDPQEALQVHAVLSQSAGATAHVIDVYKSAIRESVSSGVLSRADVHRLDSLRTRLRVTDADHERVMAELVEEDRDLMIGGLEYGSVEKQLQLKTYADALAAHLERQAAAHSAPDEAIMRRLRDEYGITPDEHRAVLDHLVRSRDGIARHVLDAPAAIEEAAAGLRHLEPSRSSVSRFLASLLRRRSIRSVEGLLHATGLGPDGDHALRDGLLSPDAAIRRAAVLTVASRLSAAASARMIDAFERTAHLLSGQTDAFQAVRLQLSSPDPYIRATAFYLLESAGAATAADRDRLIADEHPLVRDTLAHARTIAAGAAVAEPSTLEKMIALRSIGIFEALEPEDLIRLARASTEVWLSQGDVVCREGDTGDELFVLLAGEVSILHRDDAGVDRVIAVEGAGTCIGELAVLDSAPREATVIASSVAVRALRLNGRSFDDARNASPALSGAIIRLLARRVRAAATRLSSASPAHPQGQH